MNSLGDNGWELVSVYPNRDSVNYVFKKPEARGGASAKHHLTDAAQERIAKADRHHENTLLEVLQKHPGASYSELARHCGWFYKDGSPNKSQVQRLMKTLHRGKIVSKDRDGFELADKGRKALEKVLNGAAVAED